MIPRIRGRVGQATEPDELKGKWFFELWLTTIGGGEGDRLGTFGPWDTEELAHQELRNAARLASESAEKGLTGRVSGQYLDMKTNTVRHWDRRDEH